ncbi:MAG: hypothetical protein MUP81_06355 [Dehalococcoidia bacterium]|nr:hypothetical protein [Dehalococcoidia bacterium]
MKNPIIKGTFKVKLIKTALNTRRDIGMQDAAIIHEVLDKLLNQLDPITRRRISFSDCEIVEDKEERIF